MSLLLLRVDSTQGGFSLGPNGTLNCLMWLRSDKDAPSSPEVVQLGAGNVVERWIDQSGSGNDVVSTTGFEPVLSVNAINCDGVLRDSITFNGIDQFFSNSPIPFNGTQSFSIFVAFKAGNNLDSTMVSFRDGETGALVDGVGLSLQPNIFVSTVESDVESKLISLSKLYGTGEVVIYELFVDLGDGGQEVKIRANGSDPLTIDLDGTTIRNTSQEVNIGRYGPGGRYFTGEMLEVIIFGNDDDATRLTVEDYLFNKWCVTQVGAGPGDTSGTFWWWCVKEGLPYVDDDQSMFVNKWRDSSGRELIAAQSNPALQPQYGQAINNGIGGVNMGSSNLSFPYFDPIATDAHLEALGALHNLDELTAFSLVFATSDTLNPDPVGNIFAWGDGTDRQIVLRMDSTANTASLALKTVGNPPVLIDLSPTFPDGRQLNNAGPPNSTFVLSLKILTVNLLAGVAIWDVAMPNEVAISGGLVQSTTIFFTPISDSLDVGTDLRLAGSFPGTTHQGTGGKYFVVEAAFYDHGLNLTEKQQILDYFTSVYNNTPGVELFTPIQISPTEVLIPWLVTNASNSNHIASAGIAPQFFRDVGTIPDAGVQPSNSGNPLFVGGSTALISASDPPPIFIDTVPGPGTYFYKSALAEDLGLVLPAGAVPYISPPSNEVSITVV